MRRRFAVAATPATGGAVRFFVLELVGVVVALWLLVDFRNPATPAPRTPSRRPTTTHGHDHGFFGLGLIPVTAVVRPRIHLLLGGGIRLGRVRV